MPGPTINQFISDHQKGAKARKNSPLACPGILLSASLILLFSKTDVKEATMTQEPRLVLRCAKNQDY